MKKPMKNKGRSGAGKMAPEITISIRMMPSKMSKSEKKIADMRKKAFAKMKKELD
tara:strand:+ start:220 stop:384 length:165 start_codon:yes stop_codon:yes gene_type:complete